MLQAAKEVQLAADREHLASVDPEDITTFEVGQLVLVQPHDNPLSGRRPKSKFDFKWSGPYQVESKVGINTYRLRDLTQSDTFITRNVMDIIGYNHDPRNLTPQEVAAAEKQEYVINSIISHTGNSKNVSKMKFQVRWEGFDPKDDTFEPYENLQDNIFLHKYLAQNGMLDLVLPRFRTEEIKKLASTRKKLNDNDRGNDSQDEEELKIPRKRAKVVP